MPIYEYRCDQCHHQLEIIQKINAPVLTCCPNCGKESLHKLISRSSFQLKGSGWYATDFKNTGQPTETKAEEKKMDKNTDTQTSSAETNSTAKPNKTTGSETKVNTASTAIKNTEKTVSPNVKATTASKTSAESLPKSSTGTT